LPYERPEDAPDYLPAGKKAQWVAVWNSAYNSDRCKNAPDREACAFQTANGVVLKLDPDTAGELQDWYATYIAKQAENRVVRILSKAKDFIIYGPASVEIIDKERDLINMDAVEKALDQLIKRGRVSVKHSDTLVGEILREYKSDDGKVYRTHVSKEPPRKLYVVAKIYDDTRIAQEVRKQIVEGKIRSFSISGEALEEKRRVDEKGVPYTEITKVDLSAVTVCEEGMNPMAKFEVIKKMKAENIEVSDIPEVLEALDEVIEKAKRDRWTNPDGSFKGGFEGCVNWAMAPKSQGGGGVPTEERARALCAYIGRKTGKIPSKKEDKPMTEEENKEEKIEKQPPQAEEEKKPKPGEESQEKPPKKPIEAMIKEVNSKLESVIADVNSLKQEVAGLKSKAKKEDEPAKTDEEKVEKQEAKPEPEAKPEIGGELVEKLVSAVTEALEKKLEKADTPKPAAKEEEPSGVEQKRSKLTVKEILKMAREGTGGLEKADRIIRGEEVY